MMHSLTGPASPCFGHLSLGRTTRRVSWAFARCRQFSTTSPGKATTANAIKSIIYGVYLPADYTPPTQPPSARPVETRKSQMIRMYTSLLRSSPVIVLFQHSSLTAAEWTAVRRELKKALATVQASSLAPGVDALDLSTRIQLQALRTNIFDVALKIVEFHSPESSAALASTPRTARGPLVHDLSQAAYDAVRRTSIPPESIYAQIEPLMVGPLAALVFPIVSPAHLAAALSVLAPMPGSFPAPARKKNPGYHEATCQNGLAKLALVGGRIEGKVFDQSGINWFGGIRGGLDGLRSQLVGVLQGAGLGLTTALEGGGRNIWLAMEGRKSQLEDNRT